MYWALIKIYVDLFSLGTAGSGASADGSCLIDDFDCLNHDQLGMEAIRSLHRQLDDDEDGDIDLAESDDVSIFIMIFVA